MPPDAETLSDRTAFEADLAALRPRSDQIDRDRLMYLAGQATATPRRPRSRWIAAWATTVAASAAIGVVLTLVLARPEPKFVNRIVYVPVPARATDVRGRPAEPSGGQAQASTNPPDTLERPISANRAPSTPRLADGFRLDPFAREQHVSVMSRQLQDLLDEAPATPRRPAPGTSGARPSNPKPVLSRGSLKSLLDDLTG